MTSEPMYITLEEKMATGLLLLSEHVPQSSTIETTKWP